MMFLLRDGPRIAVRVRPGNVQKTVALLKDVFERNTQTQPFDFFFLDDRFNQLYKKEQRSGRSVVDSLVGKAIGKTLQDPEGDVTILRKVKDHGKKLSDNAEAKAEYHVANTIYYAAIASALVFHNKRITKFSYKDLRKYFRHLDKEKWIPEALRALFSRAAEYCQMRQRTL